MPGNQFAHFLLFLIFISFIPFFFFLVCQFDWPHFAATRATRVFVFVGHSHCSQFHYRDFFQFAFQPFFRLPYVRHAVVHKASGLATLLAHKHTRIVPNPIQRHTSTHTEYVLATFGCTAITLMLHDACTQ